MHLCYAAIDMDKKVKQTHPGSTDTIDRLIWVKLSAIFFLNSCCLPAWNTIYLYFAQVNEKSRLKIKVFKVEIKAASGPT